MVEKYILTLDQSTSGTKSILVNHQGKLVAKTNIEHQQYYPRTDWVEHDPLEIYNNTVKIIKMMVEDNNLTGEQIAAIGITNQRETALVWDKNTGKPVHNAVVWQCQRGKEICNQLKEEGYEDKIREKTGLLIDPYFSASKVKWILDNVEGVKARAQRGELLFGTIDSWLIWKLTEGEVHATDFSNASRTMLFNIRSLEWDQELLDLFDIPSSMMPEVKSSDEIFGYTSVEETFDNKLPIAGIMGDSHAALFGQNCFGKGTAKATYGTGSSIVMNIGKEYQESQNGIVTSLGWGLNGNVTYIFEGNIHATGATIKWLADNLELIVDSAESEELANSVASNEGVYFVPAFVGLGAPYWNNEARAMITGLGFNTDKSHIVRSALEAIAYQIKDVLDLMIEESGINLKELRVDGGPTRNDFLIQFQADMLDVPVTRIKIEEISALGSTFMAGLAVGYWKIKKDIETLRETGSTFVSEMKKEEREKLYSGWKEAVDRVLK